MRILHLINQASEQAHPTTLSLLAHARQSEHQVMLLGGEPLERAAQTVDLSPNLPHIDLLGVPLGQAVAGWPRMHHWMRHQRQQPDVVHCWSIGSLSLAMLLYRQTPKILTVTTRPTCRQIHWLSMMTNEGSGQPAKTTTENTESDSPKNPEGTAKEASGETSGGGGASGGGVTILCVSSTIRRELLGGGVDPKIVHVLRPGLDMSWIQRDQRECLRSSWEVAQTDRVVLLLSDPPTATDAAIGTLALGLANAAMPKTKLHLLVHPDQRHRLRSLNAMRPMEAEHQVLTTPLVDQPWKVLPACDAAICLDQGGSGLSMLWAMAGGVPLIGEASYATSEILEDRHNTLFVKPGETRHLSGQLQRVFTDEQLAWKLRDAARHEAYSFFSKQRFTDNMTSIYKQVFTQKPIEIPDLPITGGLRFSGRA